MIPRDLESGLLNLEEHHLALAITKKTLDENHFRTAQKTTDREQSLLQEQASKKIGLEVEAWILDCPY